MPDSIHTPPESGKDPGAVLATLAPDRRTLIVKIPGPDTARTVTVRWENAATDAQVSAAIEHASRPTRLEVGQRNTTRRWHFGRYWIWWHKMTGPPTWIWPRCFIHKRELVFGWLRLAFAFAVTVEPRVAASPPTSGEGK